MRYLLTLLTLAVIHLSSVAQTICTPGARWRTFSFGDQYSAVGETTCLGDTILEGVTARILRHRDVGQLGGTSIDQVTFQYVTDEPEMMRFYDPFSEPVGGFDTLVLFGALPGEGWTWGPAGSNVDVTVLDNGTRMIGTEQLRYVVVNEVSSMFTLQDTIYERIGSVFLSYFVPWMCFQIDAVCPGLVCYGDEDLEYFAPFADTALCEGSLSTPDLTTHEASPHLWPNPSDASPVTLALDIIPTKATLVMRDALGREVQRNRITDHYTTLTLQGASGVYMVEVWDGSGRIATERLIVE